MTLPVMIYFASNHALADLFRVYFYDNIFYYSYKPYLINKLYYCAHNLVHSVRDNPALWMMIAAGLCWFTIRLKDKKEFLFLLITGMIDVFFVYQGGRDRKRRVYGRIASGGLVPGRRRYRRPRLYGAAQVPQIL